MSALKADVLFLYGLVEINLVLDQIGKVPIVLDTANGVVATVAHSMLYHKELADFQNHSSRQSDMASLFEDDNPKSASPRPSPAPAYPRPGPVQRITPHQLQADVAGPSNLGPPPVPNWANKPSKMQQEELNGLPVKRKQI